MARLRLLLACVLPGCVVAERVHEASLPLGEVERVFGDVERGAAGYLGAPDADRFDVGVRSWAHGSSRAAALRRADTSTWGVAAEGELLDLWGRSPDPGAGVDLVVLGPRTVDVELVVLEGVAEAHGVTGSVRLTASAVAMSGASGPLDVLATAGSAEVEAFPTPGDTLRIEAVGGDVVLALPRGAPIDLRVDADPAYGVSVTDLGFDRFEAGPGHVRASAGDGSVPVDVVVDGGGFWLWEAALEAPGEGDP
jgi:hypothetical protein